MELKMKDLLEAIVIKPFGNDTNITVELINEDGTYGIYYGKEYVIEHYGEKFVDSCEIHFHTIDIWVKEF